MSSRPKSFFERGARRLHDVVLLAELLHRLEQVVEVQHERGDRTDGDDALIGEVSAQPDHAHDGDDADAFHEREVAGRDAQRRQVRLVLRFVGEPEPLRERRDAPERLDDAHAGQTLLQGGEVRADALAHLEVGTVRFTPEPARHQHHRRHDHESAHRKRPTQDEEHHHRAGEQQEVGHHRGEPGLDELLERVDVGRHPRHEPSRLFLLEEVEAQAQQVAEHSDAQVAEEVLAETSGQQDCVATKHERDECRHDVEQRGAVERGRVVLQQALVDPPAHQRRTREQAEHLTHDAEPGEHRVDPYRSQHRQGPPQHAATLTALEPVLLGDHRARRHQGDPSSTGTVAATGWWCSACASTARYRTDRASSSSCVPCSATPPPSSNTTRSANAIVAGR